jgi:tetratricopeptide (TPR) repeat protein
VADQELDTVSVDARPPTRAPALGSVELPSRFTPIAMLGAGAMGYVVAARDRSLDRDVAVKVITASRLGDAKSRDRFVREARTVAALRHDHIVTVHDLDPHGRFIVMELVRGETLRDRIARGPLPFDEVRRIGAALLAALAAAHAAGVIHRDVKPANVLLGEDGSIKLADFGVAATADSELTKTGEVIGTPAYMAPEQLRGHASDLRVDLYAAGATLFEAATGERLHTPDRKLEIRAAIKDPVLAAAITRAVSERPGDRFADARAFAAALVAARRRPWRVFAALVLVVAGVVAIVATREDAAEPAATDAAIAGTSLDLGLAALERQELAAAETHLRAAVTAEPARARFYLAILYWWTSHTTPQVVAELDAALAAGLDDRLAALARGVRSLVLLEYPDVIATFEQLRARYPDDRNVLYGLFEALFHGGRPGEAMVVYHRLREVAPRFGLARHHALHHAIARGQIANARAALEGATGLDHVRWSARIDAAGGDFAAARQRLADARKAAGERDADVLGWELVAVHAAAGEVEQAHALAIELAARGLQTGNIPLLGLALARGTTAGTDASAYLWRIAVNAASVPASIHTTTREAWVELATLVVIEGNVERARAALANVPAALDARMLEAAIARALLAGSIDDRDALARFAGDNPFPEARAVAAALLAERANRPRVAAEAWRAALAADGSGRFRIALSLRLARVLAKLGEHDAAVAACEPVIRPRLFHWSWGAAVGECLQLTAAAHRAAGRIAESQAVSRTVLAMRAGAPASDPLVVAARANLSAGRTPP